MCFKCLTRHVIPRPSKRKTQYLFEVAWLHGLVDEGDHQNDVSGGRNDNVDGDTDANFDRFLVVVWFVSPNFGV